MSRHVKQIQIKVKVDKADGAALRELAKREAELRKDPSIGGATMLRELGMPRVHERLAELRGEAQRTDDNRRSGDDRRAVVPA
jgi:hypothetical protein